MACRKFDKIIIPLRDSDEAPVAGLDGPFTSTIDVSSHEDYAIQLKTTGGIAGDFELQASIDGVNFVTIAASITPVDPAGDDILWNVTDAHYKYVRVSIPADVTGAELQFMGEILRDG